MRCMFLFVLHVLCCMIWLLTSWTCIYVYNS